MSPSSVHRLLIAYFRSGWAFFIPYLFFYQLYAWQKWPANSFAPAALGSGGHIPALLHVYWALHGLHILLAALAFRSWGQAASRPVPTVSPAQTPLSISKGSALRAIAPWLTLALIFALPGVYLEWPSDPWEHLRRITEWSVHPVVGDSSAGYKSFYFFAYSCVGWLSPTLPLSRLNVYYVAICLLLAWQYYRLAKAVGLDSRWAFLFVVVNVLTFGNSSFSFYRYYGLASTMISQLGAVALTRIVLAAARNPQLSLRSFFRPSQLSAHSFEGADSAPSFLLLAPCSLCLLALIAFNHVQGLGIAGLSISSIAVWRLLEWKRSAGWWLVGTTVILCVATLLWWPRHPMIDIFYRTGGWLNAWHGFNLFAWPSPAADRAMQILGVFGVFNVGAGLLLLRRNHVAGWLTVGPLIALALPLVALPFSNMLAAKSTANIVTFHRMLFGIPSGLALVCCISQWGAGHSAATKAPAHRWRFLGVALAVIAVVALAPQGPSNNRFWHVLYVAPDDLQLRGLLSDAGSVAGRLRGDERARLVTTRSIGNVFNTVSPRQFPYSERLVGQPMSESLRDTVAIVHASRPARLTPDEERSILTRDPFTTDSSAWTTLAGSPPEFVTGLKNSSAGPTALQNPAGLLSEVFSADLVPIDPAQTYRVELSVRQRFGPNATTYLAVAWHNKEGRLLVSNVPSPTGAGAPAGWGNGTFSYFGLIAAPAPTAWTTYRISFGPGEAATIPPQARFVRVGALLNYNAAPAGVTQLTNVRLWRRLDGEILADGVFPSDDHPFVVAPPSLMVWTHASQAGLASHHWPSLQVATDLAGGAEVIAAARATGGVPVGLERVIWELPAPAKSSVPDQ